MHIDVSTIKGLMRKRSLSQVELSRHTLLGTKTIGRACSGKELRKGNVERIAKALGVTVDKLTSPSSDQTGDGGGKEPGLMRLVMDLEPWAMNKLHTAAYRYQVQAKTIVQFAPLLFSILAEASLRERKQSLQDWVSKMSALSDTAPASSDERSRLDLFVAEVSQREQESIDRRDLHGYFVSPQESETEGLVAPGVTGNPFLALLRRLSGELLLSFWGENIEPPEYEFEALVDFGEGAFQAKTEVEEMANVTVYEEWISLRNVPPELLQPHRGNDRARWLASYYGDAKGDFDVAWDEWRKGPDYDYWLERKSSTSAGHQHQPQQTGGDDGQTQS